MMEEALVPNDGTKQAEEVSKNLAPTVEGRDDTLPHHFENSSPSAALDMKEDTGLPLVISDEGEKEIQNQKPKRCPRNDTMHVLNCEQTSGSSSDGKKPLTKNNNNDAKREVNFASSQPLGLNEMTEEQNVQTNQKGKEKQNGPSKDDHFSDASVVDEKSEEQHTAKRPAAEHPGEQSPLVCTHLSSNRPSDFNDLLASGKRKRCISALSNASKKKQGVGLMERGKMKPPGQWSHLSEEELKRLRRVKNRESVEKCRTKQRLRMEALQVEQTCLQVENKALREAAVLLHSRLHEITFQIAEARKMLPEDQTGYDEETTKS